MKAMPSNRTRPVVRAVVIALSLVALVPVVDATNISKSFEFGPGTSNPTSNVRTYEIPSGLEVAAVVKYRRLGTGKDGIPIDIELREPDTAPGIEGPVVEKRSASATPTEQSIILRSLPNNRGCGRPWRIRVRYAGTGLMPSAVFGTARLDDDGALKSISAEMPGYIIKGASKEVKIGGPTGFGQGALGITANWNHMIGPVPGPSPVKFRVFLVYYPEESPSNQVITGSVEAYSTNEADATPRFSMIYRATGFVSGRAGNSR